MTLPLFLALFSAAAWSIVYVLAIAIGFRQKTCAFPFPALALNLTWEALYTFLGFTQGPQVLAWMDPVMLAQPWVGALWRVQSWVNLFWLVLDGLILVTHLRFGRRGYDPPASRAQFVAGSLTALAAALLLQVAFFLVFGSFGCAYAAFLQNLVMSLLFLGLLRTRGSARGQNMAIALGKCLGTLAAALGFILVLGNRLILALGALCLAADILYVHFLNRAFKKSKSLL